MDTKKLIICLICLIITGAILLRPRSPKLQPEIPTHYKIELFNYPIPPNDSTPLLWGLIVYVDSSRPDAKKIWLDVKGMTLREVYNKYNNGKVLNP